MEAEETHAEEEGVAAELNHVGCVVALVKAFSSYSVVELTVPVYDVVLRGGIQCRVLC